MAIEKRSDNLKPRPPIVVVVGHVDHGKTSFLDYVRKMTFRSSHAVSSTRKTGEAGEPRSVAEREAGGITQAVGAYEIVHMVTHSTDARGAPSARKITFIDTPGHEAFSKMRSRGAEVADLAILIVAADEGVKPQTKEAIGALNDAKTPFIVAINKIDKTGGDVERVKKDLGVAGVFLEGYGGSISYHGISAKTGEGISELLDLVVLAADLENLTYDPGAHVSGFILEARHDSQRGSEASIILKNGTLKRGETVYTKTTSGKVKILEDFLERPVTELVPSAPGVIIGFEKLPQVGEVFSGVPIVQEEKKLVPKVVRKKEDRVLNLILKASDGGSLEALSQILRSLEKKDTPLNIVEEKVGDVTDGDLKTAIAMGAHIVGFKIKVQKGARNLAEAHEVHIVTSEIIYDLVKVVEEFLTSAGKPATLGELEVLAVFNQKKLTEQLIGGRVLSGIVKTKAPFDIMRGATVVSDGKTQGAGRILTLREGKKEIISAETGKEIGLLVNSPALIVVGDRLVVRK
jgi:translation initiation factor IF-2